MSAWSLRMSAAAFNPNVEHKGRKLSVCKRWKTIFFPKVSALRFNNRHGWKNRNSSGEDGQVAHCVNSRSIQSSREWMENKYAVHGSLSAEEKERERKKISSSQTFGHFQIRDVDVAEKANGVTNQQISNNSAINQRHGDGAPGGCPSPRLLPSHFSFRNDG